MRKILNKAAWDAYVSELQTNWMQLSGPLPKKFPVIVSPTVQSNGPDTQKVTHEYLYSEDVRDLIDPPSQATLATQTILTEIAANTPKFDPNRFADFIKTTIQTAIDNELANSLE